MLKPGPTTFTEYQQHSTPERYEIVAGQPFLMSPAPRPEHQLVVVALASEFRRLLQGSSCRAYVAPIDVKLSETDVVQPDVVVVCRPEQRRPTHLEGPPALVVEVLSESTRRHDLVRKMELYARSGVPEYWVVTPRPSMLQIFTLDDQGYRLAATCADQGDVHSPTLPQLALDLATVFDGIENDIEEVREVSLPYRS